MVDGGWWMEDLRIEGLGLRIRVLPTINQTIALILKL